jgi:hypothetical protein
VGNRNPHPRHPNAAATSVVAEKQEDPATSVVIAEKQEDAATSGICAGEPNHVGTPASAELSNDAESGVQALLEGLFSSNPAVSGFAEPSNDDQEVESLVCS